MYKMTGFFVGFVLCCSMQQVFASTADYSNLVQNKSQQQHFSFNEFKFRPALNFWGYAGSTLIGDAQVLLPLTGTQGNLWYLFGEAKVAKNAKYWAAGFGSGYRKISANNNIIGGYFLLDYTDTPWHKKAIIVNPGFESLSNTWDFRANAYVPLTRESWNKNQHFAVEDWEDNVGIYDDVRFSGHTEYDRKIGVNTNSHQELNIALGVDAEIGRTIAEFKRGKFLRAYLGGYHFATQHLGSINGASGRITYRLNNSLSVEAIDTYDNYKHNTAVIGLNLALGGFNNLQHQQLGIAARLLDPIQHHIATIAHGYAVPMKTQRKTTVTYGKSSAEAIERENIWFFKSAADLLQGDGTYENPFIGLTPQNIKSIYNKQPLLYFAPGNYSFSGFRSRGIAGRFNLPNGWAMYGRTADYKMAAIGNERATFLGGFDLVYQDKIVGQAETSLNSINILNAKGSDFPNISTVDKGGENAALYLVNAQNVVLQNTAVRSISNAQNGTAIGVYLKNSRLSFECLNNRKEFSHIVANSISSKATENSDSIGIYVDSTAGDNSVINFDSGINNIKSSAGRYSYGVDIYTHSAEKPAVAEVNFNNGKNIINANGGSVGIGINSRSNALNGSTVLTTINFNNGKNYLSGYSSYGAYGIMTGAYASNDTAKQGARVSAKSSINFNGGANVIAAYGGSSGTAYGLDLRSSVSSDNPFSGNDAFAINLINFNSGINNIIGESGYNGYGIHLHADTDAYAQKTATDNNSDAECNLNFNGGNNFILGKSINNSYGIAATAFAEDDAPYKENNFAKANVNINFNGGIVNINSASSKRSYGVYTDTEAETSGYGRAVSKAMIRFLNDKKYQVVLTSNGKIRYGIYAAEPETELLDKNSNALNAENLRNYVIFRSKKTINNKANGYAVQLAGAPWLIDWD